MGVFVNEKQAFFLFQKKKKTKIFYIFFVTYIESYVAKSGADFINSTSHIFHTGFFSFSVLLFVCLTNCLLSNLYLQIRLFL